ncbi:MAG: NAD-dependent epimerase/dehydratase family protein [Candidatus Melainabacteria bacterium]|nr:NAD-dependent epimerase/dehydratase family protein [Candidatus Melainabacteria bacterium]
MRQKILITGGAGFIGSHLKKSLIDNDFQVLSIGRNTNEDIQVDFCRVEVTPTLQNVIEKFSPDVVFHLASGSNISRADENKEKEFNDTVLSTEYLVEALSKLKSNPFFVYLSSQAVYGIPKALPVLETHLTCPTTIYGKYKLETENIISQSKLKYLIFRASSIYGANQNPLKSGVIAKFVSRIKNNQSPTVYNSTDSFSDFIYINDVVSVLVKILENDFLEKNKNKIFNLGSGTPTTLNQVLEILYSYFPQAPNFKLETSTLYLNKEIKGLYLDIAKLNKLLNWFPKFSIQDGLKDMLAANSKITV